MPIFAVYNRLADIVEREFADVVVHAQILCFASGDAHKIRLDIADGSFLDAYLSRSGRYSYHWERQDASARIVYRFDNAPHQNWRHLPTFPHHFHDGAEDRAVASKLSTNPEEAIREVLTFIREMLLKGQLLRE
jgi:hypothetical protein